MKTIIFFHRLQLTDLFAPVAAELAGQMKVVHLAYSSEERDQLLRYGVTGPIVIFKDEINRLWNATDIPKKTEIDCIDSLIIKQTKGAFNLNGAIQSDRAFCLLSYAECLKLTFIYHQFWKEFLSYHDADYVMHEPTSLMMNFMAAILCAERGVQYIYQIMAKGEQGEANNLIISSFEFNCVQIEQNYNLYKNHEKEPDRARCDAFMSDFRADLNVYLGDKIQSTQSWMRLLLYGLVGQAKRIIFARRFDRFIDNVEYWNLRQNRSARKLINLVRYNNEVIFHEFDKNVPYYYYAMHCEPESVVLYHGHGLYKNQVKLIENIAAQLPPKTFLYVKDHPHDFGNRCVDDFKKLQKIPNVRLIRHHVPGKLIIAHAIGVFTINGTAGFEALLLGKQVFTFSKSFYGICPRVKNINNVKDVRENTYSSMNLIYSDDKELYYFVAAYLDTLNEGMVDYFTGRASTYGLDLNENAQKVAQSFLKYATEN
jgi:hypothetical protein